MVVTLLLLASCAHGRQPAPAPSQSTPARHVNPANIGRVGRELPPGYEVTGISGQAAAPATWGLGGDGAATPARCAALADPAIRTRIAALGATAPGGSPEDFARYIADQIDKWTKVVAFAGIKAN